ncbi:MAG: DUF1152 domain-containing protein [Deltaproteobacteria bacterium]|nr:DUF1152 domain-containing protein [Deltaproteobacteria bacterium]
MMTLSAIIASISILVGVLVSRSISNPISKLIHATDEIEKALSVVAKGGGLLGAWCLTPKVVAEMLEVIKRVNTEASAIPVECALGAWGEKKIRNDERKVRMTHLTALTFFLSPSVIFQTLSRPARALVGSASLEDANAALHAIGLKTEIDLERERYRKRR